VIFKKCEALIIEEYLRDFEKPEQIGHLDRSD